MRYKKNHYNVIGGMGGWGILRVGEENRETAKNAIYLSIDSFIQQAHIICIYIPECAVGEGDRI